VIVLVGDRAAFGPKLEEKGFTSLSAAEPL
jgi:hypothetical protein